MNEQKSQSFSKRYIRGELLMQFWNAAVKAFSLTNSFFILTALSVYQFGLYQLILSILAVVENFSSGLFDEIVVNDTARGLAEDRPGEAKRLFREFAIFKISFGALLTAGLFFGADLVALRYGKDIGMFMRIASFLLVIETTKTVQEMFFFSTVSFSGVGTQAFQEFCKLAILGWFFWIGAIIGVREVLIATVGAAFAALAFSSFFFLREYRRVFGAVRMSPERMLRRAFRRYGPRVALRYSAAKIIKNIRPWVIKFFLNTEAVAFYTLAINLISLAQSIFPISMISRLLPWEVGNRERLRYIFTRSVKYVLWGGTAVAAASFIFVPPIIGFLFPKYGPALPLFRSMLLILPLYGVYKIHKSILVVLREQNILTARIVAEVFMVTGLNAILLPLIGLFGVAAEYTITYAWRAFLFHYSLEKAHPYLGIRMKSLVTFDVDDRRFFGKTISHLFNPLRRLWVA